MSLHNLSSKISIRIYYEDTDAGGIVYHSKYLNFAERARAEFLRNLSLEQTYIKEKYQIQFVVKNLKVSYMYSCKLDDQINIVTDLESTNRAKLCFRHIFHELMLMQEKMTKRMGDMRLQGKGYLFWNISEAFFAYFG